MKFIKIFQFVFLGFVFAAWVNVSTAQTFDYSRYPDLDFTIEHLELQLDLATEETSIDGIARYRLSANVGGTDSVVMQAAHMDIQQVMANETETSYYLVNDSLIVSLPSTPAAGQELTVEIKYRAVPKFGVLTNENGTIWTSFLPLSTRHWLPVIDHPRVSFTTEITVTSPSGMQVLAPGVKTGEEVLSVDQIETSWISERGLPASALWFAVGDFDKDQTGFGIKKINIAAESGIMGINRRQDLLQYAYNSLRRTEQYLGFEYPYDEFNVIVLEDHFWETKSYGAGSVIIYLNRGNLRHQLLRGIYAQWFGVYQREGPWNEGEMMNLIQTLLHFQVSDSSALMDVNQVPEGVSTNPYGEFGPARWNAWQQFYPVWSDSSQKRILTQSLSDLISGNRGVQTWHRYAEYWYERSGQPWFELPELTSARDSAATDTTIYNVRYYLDDAESMLTLSFEAEKGGFTELVTLPLVRISAGGTDTVDVTVTGKTDSVLVRISPALTNAYLLTGGREHLVIDEYKPARFWLYQLRNSMDTGTQKIAASKLGNHADNPDLQLAIMDYLNRELAPQVRAALFESLSEITHGAAGTEQIFLEGLQSTNADVRKASIRALKHFSANADVAGALRGMLVEADSLHLFNMALDSFTGVVSDSADVLRSAEEIIKTDTTGYKAIQIISQLPEFGYPDRAVRQAQFYLDDQYEYAVRRQALVFLLQYDNDTERWRNRLDLLLGDVDPRIRFIAVRGMARLPGIDVREFMGDRLLDEYDARVYHEMKAVMDTAAPE